MKVIAVEVMGVEVMGVKVTVVMSRGRCWVDVSVRGLGAW